MEKTVDPILVSPQSQIVETSSSKPEIMISYGPNSIGPITHVFGVGPFGSGLYGG